MTFVDASIIAFLGALSLFGVVLFVSAVRDAQNRPPWEDGATCMVCRKNPCIGCM